MSFSEESLDSIAGIITPIGLVYVFILFAFHFKRKYKGTDKIILQFSKFSLVMVLLSLISILLTYYTPHLGSSINECYCSLLWRISLITFIAGLYCVKFMYVTRVYIYFKGPSSAKDGLFTGKVPWTILMLFVSMSLCFITIIVVQFFTVSGECHQNMFRKGCINNFHDSNIYIAMCMIAIDVTLFTWYSHHWNLKIQDVITHSPASLVKSNEQLLKSFKIQLFLTACALITTFVDGILHLLIRRYFAISIFVLDNLMVASANALGFTKLRKYLYWRFIKCGKGNNPDLDDASKIKSDNSSKNGGSIRSSKALPSKSSTTVTASTATPVINNDDNKTIDIVTKTDDGRVTIESVKDN